MIYYMTAPAGTHSFTTKESKQSEINHNQWIGDVLADLGPDWSRKKSMSLEELTGQPGVYSLDKKKNSQTWVSDGGYIFYRKNLVGVAENKYQKARENACERAARYLALPLFRNQPHRFFLSVYGPGFIKQESGGSTGPFLDAMMSAGVYVIENVNEEQEFKHFFRKWVLSII